MTAEKTRTIREVVEGSGSLDEAAEKIKSLAKSVERTEERTFRAISPAAAWAFLVFVDFRGAIIGSQARSRAIYRGQSKACWDLSPRLGRLDGPERDLAEEQATHFADICNIEFNKLLQMDSLVDWPPVHKESGRAAAQHFHMDTALLDWSAFYSVALDFATKEANGEMAAVWWLRLSDQVMSDLRIILPPPFVNRLYLQRGVFVDVPNDKTKSRIENTAYKVEFPALYHEKVKFFVDKSVHELCTLEPPSPWFEELHDYCRSKDGANARANILDTIIQYVAFQCHASQQSTPPLSPTDYIAQDYGGLSTSLGEDDLQEQIAEHILSLASRSDQEGNIGLDEQVMKILRCENAGLVDWAVPLFEPLARKKRRLRDELWHAFRGRVTRSLPVRACKRGTKRNAIH